MKFVSDIVSHSLLDSTNTQALYYTEFITAVIIFTIQDQEEMIKRPY